MSGCKGLKKESGSDFPLPLTNHSVRNKGLILFLTERLVPAHLDESVPD